MNTTPAIITVAITGSVPQKADNPTVPITPSEQIESTHEAYDAGASLAHIHVRNDDGSPSSDPARFAEVIAGIRKYCRGMIVQVSTGGRGRGQAERGSAIALKPDMASLATGSVNFPTFIYENPPALIDGLAEEMQRHNVKPEIEIFDLAMLYNSKSLSERGLLGARPHVQFVLGIKNALPARRSVLEFLLSELREVLPDATWTAAGIGRTQLEVNGWCLELGANALRTGLEDNIRFDKTRLAEGNADLVRRVAHLCVDAGRQVASPAEARAILNLPPTPPD